MASKILEKTHKLNMSEESQWCGKIRTKEIKKVYDRNSLEAWEQLVIADELCEYFTFKWGLNLTITNTYDFGYTIADHHHREGYYVFAIKDNKIVKTKWVDKRKHIGIMLNKYPNFDLITFYPKSEAFRYYVHLNDETIFRRYYIGNKYLGLSVRVSEQEFIEVTKKQMSKNVGKNSETCK